jgi:hypothetical protein
MGGGRTGAAKGEKEVGVIENFGTRWNFALMRRLVAFVFFADKLSYKLQWIIMLPNRSAQNFGSWIAWIVHKRREDSDWKVGPCSLS